MKMVAISHGRYFASVEEEARIVNEMFRDGLDVFHLRKPLHSVDELRNFLDRIEPRFLSRVTLHTFHDLVLEYPVGGLHVTERQQRKCPLATRQVAFLLKRRPELRQTASYHKLEKLRFAPGKLDYVFLSPIFDSISKPFHRAAFERDALMETLAQAKPPVLAVGGVHIESLTLIPRLGFSGAALCGALWESSNPNEALRRALSYSEPAQIPCSA